MKKKILVLGALGQIGTELVDRLRKIYGSSSVVASDIKMANYHQLKKGPFEVIDCTIGKQTAATVQKHQIGLIYHLPSLLSASAEKYPQKAFEINLVGLFQTLEVAREHNCAVFTPSTIGVFGTNTPKDKTPQETIMRPNTIYGVTKVSGELLCDYYHHRYGVDTRGVRFPGIISYKTFPGGGTTDYAVEIFLHAVKNRRYTSYIKAGTYLDMMYMPDAIDAAINLMEADPTRLTCRNAYNVTAMSFDVEELAAEIKKHIPDFVLEYNIDPVRQNIAESWPNSLDDSIARKDWDWNPKFGLTAMAEDMLKNV